MNKYLSLVFDPKTIFIGFVELKIRLYYLENNYENSYGLEGKSRWFLKLRFLFFSKITLKYIYLSY